MVCSTVGGTLAGAAARELFEDLFATDLPGRGAWTVSGVTVDPERLGIPIRNFGSTNDRIVPAATAMGTGERLDLDSGHVGMVVGSKAPSMLWEPLADWLERAGR